ncbi:hypothetical protein HPB51_007455 [Rhipicephalus microplus]|uniref:Uncharacterized protein n=1 Tax=Rhipicephalus microplus TaxID=6941 RepID=A0A9J6EZ12_RHIMP|nr:hypothetical protein HPB51_007455 [Rhipicephalus microplus]
MSTVPAKSTSPARRQEAGTRWARKPPCAKMQVRSVATWTCQENQDAPRCFSATCLRVVPGCQTHLGCVCAHCAGSTYTQTAIFGGSLHAGRAQAARASGCSKWTPASSVPPTALPDEDLAALCRERMRKNPGFTALVGPGIPSAEASTPDGNGNGDTSADFLVTFDEDFI